MAWDDAKKAQVLAAYKAAGPTPENTGEIIKEIAEEVNESPNGVRMLLIQAKVYVKKQIDPTKETPEGEPIKRPSKEDQIKALKAIISNNGAEVVDEMLDKLTGKVAAYLTETIETIIKNR